MAEKALADSASRNSNKKKLDLTGLQKLWIAGALLFFLVNIVLMCIFGLNTLLFTGNERFTLREIVIAPPPGYLYSYWNNEHFRDKRIQKICNDLQLTPGRTNLFEIDPAEVREIMLQKNPEIQNIAVRKRFPDQLEFIIQESSPFLNLGQGRCLGDQYKVASIDRFKNLALPLFLDASDETLKLVKPGDQYRSKPAEFALEFTKHLQEKYPRIRPVRIEHRERDRYMDCLIEYEKYVFRVFLPYPIKLEEELYRNKIPQLHDRLQTLHREKNYSVTINLIYKDPVIKRNNPVQKAPDKKK